MTSRSGQNTAEFWNVFLRQKSLAQCSESGVRAILPDSFGCISVVTSLRMKPDCISLFADQQFPPCADSIFRTSSAEVSIEVGYPVYSITHMMVIGYIWRDR